MTDDTIVCEDCGSDQVQAKQWVWSNTGKLAATDNTERNDQWCEACQDHVCFISHKEYVELNPEE